MQHQKNPNLYPIINLPGRYNYNASKVIASHLKPLAKQNIPSEIS